MLRRLAFAAALTAVVGAAFTCFDGGSVPRFKSAHAQSVPGINNPMLVAPRGPSGALGLGATTGTSSTVALTTTAAIPAGSSPFLMVNLYAGTSCSITSVSDGTNSYSVVASHTFTAGYCDALLAAYNASAIASGGTLTVTYSQSGGLTNWNISAGYFLPGQPISTYDQTSANGSSSATSSPTSNTTSTLSSPNEIAIGEISGFASSYTTYTVPTGWTKLNTDQEYTAGAVHTVSSLEYIIVNATTGLQFNPSASVAVEYNAAIGTFK